MGFTFESAIALPCCLVILTEVLGAAAPLAVSVHRSAALSAYASTRPQEGTESCRYIREARGEWLVYRVETKPQKTVEAVSLVKDMARAARRFAAPSERRTPSAPEAGVPSPGNVSGAMKSLEFAARAEHPGGDIRGRGVR